MNTNIRSLLAAGSLLALSAVTSHAQLLLLHSTSTFSNPVGGTSTIVNGGIDASSSIRTPQDPNSQFGIATVPTNIGTNLLSGTTYVVDTWNLDRTGTSFTNMLSSFDFNLALDFAGGSAVDLNLPFHVTLTPNSPVTGSLSYAITAGGTFTGFFNDGANNYAYTIFADGLTGNLSASGSASNATAHINLQVDLVPVPEPSTYALFGVVALMGLVAVRRFRSTKSVA